MKTTLPVNVPIYGHLSLRDKTQVQRSSHANCWLHQNSSLGLWEASNLYAHGQFVYHTEICVSCCQWFSEIKFLYLVTNPVVCPVSVFSSFCYRNTFAWYLPHFSGRWDHLYSSPKTYSWKKITYVWFSGHGAFSSFKRLILTVPHDTNRQMISLFFWGVSKTAGIMWKM